VVRAEARRRWGIVLGVVTLLCGLPIRGRCPPPGSRRAPPPTGLLPEQRLPALPNLSQVTALVSGTTEMRTWYAAPDRWRVDVIGGGTERDLYQTPEAQYVWDFGDNQLSRIVGEQPVRLPRAGRPDPARPGAAACSPRPVSASRRWPAKRVAGVDAAGLRIVPAEPGHHRRPRRHLGRPGFTACRCRPRSPRRAGTAGLRHPLPGAAPERARTPPC
jgi:hypothetical protein